MNERKQFLGSHYHVCPKSGKMVVLKSRKYRFPFYLVIGFMALLWFLVRVVPKPSRSVYPCQKAAVPLAAAFLSWLLAVFCSAAGMRKAKQLFANSRYLLAFICLVAAGGAMWWSFSMTEDAPAQAALMVTPVPNSPVGTASGIHPGRVVWVQDFASTSWDGFTGDWWDDPNTDQSAVDAMMSTAIRRLTGEATDMAAWDALFQHFNLTHGFTSTGYQAGEKIAIKINMNQDRGGAWQRGEGMPSPQAIYSLVEQLIEVVGVAGADITIYDASRAIGDPIFDKIRSNPSPDFQQITFAVKPDEVVLGRVAVMRDDNHPLFVGTRTAYLPTCVTQASYLINMALLRPHSLFGVTLCGKNHFGSTNFSGSWTPSPMHDLGDRNDPMGTYCAIVDLNGHQQLGGKTLLYLIDGLYGARNQGSSVMHYESMGDDWSSSILAAQDFIAIDSVAFDILRNEPRANDVTGNPEGYLHEGALANNPTSGSTYDPEDDGIVLQSLGVHEHWNNPNDKQYTRNLGTGDGIELLYLLPPFDASCPGDLETDGDVDGSDLRALSLEYGNLDCSAGCAFDFDDDGDVDRSDLGAFVENFGNHDCLY